MHVTCEWMKVEKRFSSLTHVKDLKIVGWQPLKVAHWDVCC